MPALINGSLLDSAVGEQRPVSHGHLRNIDKLTTTAAGLTLKLVVLAVAAVVVVAAVAASAAAAVTAAVALSLTLK